MKYSSALIAMSLAVAAAAPAQAEIIVQTDTEAWQFGFSGFNQNIGTLNSVTLNVAIDHQYRDWRLSVPGTTSQSRDVQWSIDGIYMLYSWISGAAASPYITPIQITGAGSASVALSPNPSPFVEEAVGWFTTFAGGSASLSFDPALFVYDILAGVPPHILVTGDDMGFYDAGTDTAFTIAGAHRLTQYPGGCNTGGPGLGDDFCGNAIYTLIYDYTPAGAVPEPVTWVMMLLGFGAVGFAMRRRRSQNGKTSGLILGRHS